MSHLLRVEGRVFHEASSLLLSRVPLFDGRAYRQGRVTLYAHREPQWLKLLKTHVRERFT